MSVFTDTNLRWTLNELFDVPLYLENRIRAEKRLLITVLGQASINSENSSERIVYMYIVYSVHVHVLHACNVCLFRFSLPVGLDF